MKPKTFFHVFFLFQFSIVFHFTFFFSVFFLFFSFLFFFCSCLFRFSFLIFFFQSSDGPIPGPEERFTCSQFCAYIAFSFFVFLAPIRRIVWTSDQTEFVVVYFPCVVSVHAQFMMSAEVHSCISSFICAIVRKR